MNMPQSLSQIYLHIIFSTKNHLPTIRPEIETELYAYVASVSNTLSCHAHKIGGTENHIHIACNLSRILPVSKLLEEVKKSSSKWMKTKGNKYQNFTWQNGYGAFSFGRSQLPAVVKYIEDQKEHHCKVTFKEEYLAFLKRYAIEYDERFVWD